ncbi:MAG: energy transducer TonB [Ignavibacteriaceae bacterium]
MYKYILVFLFIAISAITYSQPVIPTKAEDDSTYYIAVEEMPEPIGGIKAIMENVSYPKEAKENNIQGKVYVLAYINEEGIVEKTKIIQSVNALLDNAACDAVKNVKFTSAKQDGKTVKVEIAIPIVFKLD